MAKKKIIEYDVKINILGTTITAFSKFIIHFYHKALFQNSHFDLVAKLGIKLLVA